MKQDEFTYAADSDRFVPGLDYGPVDLMYGYVEGRNLAHGLARASAVLPSRRHRSARAECARW